MPIIAIIVATKITFLKCLMKNISLFLISFTLKIKHNMSFSKISLWFCFILLSVIALFYYPKWNKETTEATISWDVSGYYWYLPAFLIYDDLKQIGFSNHSGF